MSKSEQGLSSEQDLIYHRRFWKLQRIGWIVWALIILARISLEVVCSALKFFLRPLALNPSLGRI